MMTRERPRRAVAGAAGAPGQFRTGRARGFKPLTDAEMRGLRERCRPNASDGRRELFKMTVKYDGKIGREQHHMPTTQELPL